MADKESKRDLTIWSKTKDVARRTASQFQDHAPIVVAQAADLTKRAARTKLARTAAIGGIAGGAIGFVLPFVTITGMALLGAATVVIAKEIRGD